MRNKDVLKRYKYYFNYYITVNELLYNTKKQF